MVNAVVLIQCEIDSIAEAAQAIADIEGISDVYSVAGEWDLVAIVRMGDHEDLASVIPGGVGHRRMEHGGEHEPDPALVDAPGDSVRLERHLHPERLQQVGPAAPRGGRPVPVLRHHRPGPRRDDGGDGGRSSVARSRLSTPGQNSLIASGRLAQHPHQRRGDHRQAEQEHQDVPALDPARLHRVEAHGHSYPGPPNR